MAMLAPSFVYGVINKSLILGALVALVGFFSVSAGFAGAVLIGTLMTAVNMRTVAWAMSKMLEAGREGKTASAGWSLLLAVKMLLLIGSIWVLVAYVNVNAAGFAIGFSLFMPAIGWQMLVAAPERTDSGKGQK